MCTHCQQRKKDQKNPNPELAAISVVSAPLRFKSHLCEKPAMEYGITRSTRFKMRSVQVCSGTTAKLDLGQLNSTQLFFSLKTIVSEILKYYTYKTVWKYAAALHKSSKGVASYNL